MNIPDISSNSCCKHYTGEFDPAWEFLSINQGPVSTAVFVPVRQEKLRPQKWEGL